MLVSRSGIEQPAHRQGLHNCRAKSGCMFCSGRGIEFDQRHVLGAFSWCLASSKGAWLVATNDRGTGRCQRDGSRANSLGPCFEPRAFRLPADRYQVRRSAFQKNTAKITFFQVNKKSEKRIQK